MELGLAGKVCAVTGAGQGIGRATAERLVAEGATVLLVGRRAEPLDALAAELGERAIALPADVTDPATAALVVEHAAARGGLDVLVNNAGTTFQAAPEDLSDRDWHDQYALHVVGPMRLMRAAAPGMAQRGGGRIVNVCSSAGKRPSAMNAAYGVSKAAQLSLSRTWADLWAAQGVLVNAVTPGPVSSELWMAPGGMAEQSGAARGLSREEALEVQAAKVPLGRFAEPGEVADVIVFLCSERSSTVTGAAWSVDGGAVAIIV